MAKKTKNKVVEAYIKGVKSGEIIACRWVQLAVERHLNDLATAKKRGFRFDPDAAQHVIDFYRFLKHSKGAKAGETFALEPWQQFILWVVFGWMKKDTETGEWVRRFNIMYVEVARKNGKSTLLSGIGLYMLIGDGEGGPEVYSAATKRSQAKITFDECVRMVNSSSHLRKRIGTHRDKLFVAGTAAKFEPLGRDADTMDGLNPHCAIVDELHAHPNREIWDVLYSAIGARTQPLMAAITTAGFNRTSFCYELREHVTRVLEGTVEDDSIFGIIYTLDEGDDYANESVWAKSNPNLGISKRIDSLRSALVKAKEMPSDLNNFLTKELDIWTSSLSKWVNRDKWDACGKPVDLEALIGRSCFAGLDLSSTTDISALVLVFPPETEGEPYRIIPRFWIPESNMNLRSKRDGVPYEAWNRAGLVSATPGDVIDHDFIVAEISELAAKYKIEELAFDRWGSVQLVQKLQAADMKVIQYGQGFATMGPAMKTIEEMILSERLAHGNNAPLNWMADNLVVRSDPAGNLKPDKAKSTEKIDGMVALIMALDRAVRNEVIDTTSIYEKRGMRTL